MYPTREAAGKGNSFGEMNMAIHMKRVLGDKYELGDTEKVWENPGPKALTVAVGDFGSNAEASGNICHDPLCPVGHV